MLEKLKESLNHPYKTRDLFSIFVVLFLLITIPLTVFEVNSNQEIRSRAATSALKTAPTTVTIISPGNGTSVGGNINVSVSALNKEFTVKIVKLLVDGKLIGTLNNPNSGGLTGSIVWETEKETNGLKKLAVAAVTTDGTTVASEIKVTVNNIDQVKPTVSFSNLSDGGYVSGSSFTIALDASDNNGVQNIIFKIDGELVGNLVSKPYEYNWVLGKVAAGFHTLSATAFDYVGNQFTSTITIYRGLKDISTN